MRKVKNPLFRFPFRHRRASLPIAQQAFADYLHSNRALPYFLADQIAKNSPRSLSSILSSLPSLVPALVPSSFRRHLNFHPPDELSFFLESIGLRPGPQVRSHPSPFLSDQPQLLSIASILLLFGFPWKNLGFLYLHSPVFQFSSDLLSHTLARFSHSGLDRACIIAACLAFPRVFQDPQSEKDLLLGDLHLLLDGFQPTGNLEENVGRCLRLCSRVRLVYEMGCRTGELAKTMGDRWLEILRSEEVDLERTIEFFCSLGVEKQEVWKLILKHPELLECDLKNWEISMPEYLEHAGFSGKELSSTCGRHQYAMGRNKLENLPGCLRILGYDTWLLEKVRCYDFKYLSPEFLEAVVEGPGGEMDLEFHQGLERLKACRVESFLMPKLEFLHRLGFGRNGITIRAMRLVTGNKEDLKERFDCLLDMGIKYPDLCKMVSTNPKLLNRSSDVLREKVDFLCRELGLTVRYLNNSPGYLSFDLEKRIKPRYRMLNWLRSKGLLDKRFAPSVVVSVSEKTYVNYLRKSHPAAPKFWFELFKFGIDFERVSC